MGARVAVTWRHCHPRFSLIPFLAVFRFSTTFVERLAGAVARVTVCTVKHTEFWRRMDGHFGAGYSHSVAADQVLSELGSVTANAAIARGDSLKHVWRAVCNAYEIPEKHR